MDTKLQAPRIAFPVTPSGKASLVDLWTESSHRVAGEAVWIGFETDPAVVREFVPEPLEVDDSGLVYLYAFDAVGYTDRSLTEFVSPERVTFAECMIWIPCTWKGERYIFAPFSWTNREFLAYFGRLLGMPQKLGKVQMSRFHPADPVFNEPHEGIRVAVSVENLGLVLRAYLDLKRQDDGMPLLTANGFLPEVAHRNFYDVVNGRSAIDDLIVHWSDGLTPGPIWAGDAWLRFYEAENEEVIRFQPSRVVGGWFSTLAFRQPTANGHPPAVLYDFLKRP
jgi:Acetoacetate decarboxylase (ADC)